MLSHVSKPVLKAECCLCACAAATLEEPKFIPGRYRRDASLPDVVSTTAAAAAADGLHDAFSDPYYSVEDDAEFFPTSQYIGTDWNAVEGIVVLISFYSMNNFVQFCLKTYITSSVFSLYI